MLTSWQYTKCTRFIRVVFVKFICSSWLCFWSFIIGMVVSLLWCIFYRTVCFVCVSRMQTIENNWVECNHIILVIHCVWMCCVGCREPYAIECHFISDETDRKRTSCDQKTLRISIVMANALSSSKSSLLFNCVVCDMRSKYSGYSHCNEVNERKTLR